VALGLPQGNLLIDTPPDLRTQLLREGIGLIHAVLYTHQHADHMLGLDDLRIFSQYLDADLPIFCEPPIEERIRKIFDYAFDPITRQYPAGGVPRLVFRQFNGEPLEVLGTRVVPIPMRHGRHGVLGYRIGNLAYCTDTNGIPPSSMALLEGLDVLVLDCLRRRPHPTHFSLEESIEMARRLAPQRTLFTHMSHNLEHEEISALLPPGMELAYDGLRIPLGLG
jgi:phosphoribosyl 1,2-cyclic phosphate phosphodiesterase